MGISRRQFLGGVGGSLTYILVLPEAHSSRSKPKVRADHLANSIAHRDWLKISSDGLVTAHTARNELGQGVKTLLTNVISQGLEISQSQVRLVMGDTDLCPNDGSTTGSNATRSVVWAYWRACFEIRRDLVEMAARRLSRPARDLVYQQGSISARSEPALAVEYHQLANGQVAEITTDDQALSALEIPPYKDPGGHNVNAQAIVTGQMEYTADLPRENCLYAGLLASPYHSLGDAGLPKVNFSAAEVVPGVKRVGIIDQRYIGVLADSFTALQKGLKAIDAEWPQPQGPAELPIESTIRNGRKLVEIKEHHGRPFATPGSRHKTIKESYLSQYGTQVPLETDSALVELADGKMVIHLSTQNPFGIRQGIASRLGMPVETVRIISCPAGGAFGAKNSHRFGLEAARLARWAGGTVKVIRTRREDIQKDSRYKAAVVFDFISTVNRRGNYESRRIDIHQDVGSGTSKVYEIPNRYTALYRTELPFKRAIMRGTSYTQTTWALESHVDMVATKAGIDPLEFRKHNAKRSFSALIDHCAQQLNYKKPLMSNGHGVGFAMIRHGGRQDGVIGAEVAVNKLTGEVRVIRLAGAFDIGLVMNVNTATTGVKGSMLWGLSWALLEEVELDLHRCHTTGFSNYQLARFENVPEISVRFMGDTSNGPRGCGEMPGPPTTAAICNAVYHATGVRFYTLPLTPERVKAALA